LEPAVWGLISDLLKDPDLLRTGLERMIEEEQNRTDRRSKYIGDGFSSSLLYDVQMVDEASRRGLSVTLKGARA
jgi:hypothetical protein